MATYNEIVRILDKYNIPKDGSNRQFSMLGEFKAQDVETYVQSCILLKDLMGDACANVTMQSICRTISHNNRTFLSNLQKTYSMFISKLNLEKPYANKLFLSLSEQIKECTSTMDNEIKSASSKYIADICKIRKLSDAFAAGLEDEKLATKIYTNCMKRMQLFYSAADDNNIKEIIFYTLSNIDSKTPISKDDLLKVSERCASFYADATVAKIDGTCKHLKDFSAFIFNKLEKEKQIDNIFQINQYELELNGKDLRNVLLASPSIFTVAPETIAFNIELIKGEKTLGNLISEFGISASANVRSTFDSIMLDYTPFEMQQLYVNNLSCLSTSPTVLLNSLEFMHGVATDVFGEGTILPANYLSQNNFAQIAMLNKFNDIEGRKRWANNLKLLSKIMPQEKLQEYFLTNFRLASVPTSHIRDQITKTILSSTSAEQLQKELDRLINKNFYFEDTTNKPSKAEKGKFNIPAYRIGGKKNSSLTFDLGPENARHFLEELGYTPDFLQNWRTNITNATTTEEKTEATNVDLETITICNDFLNSIRVIANMLENKPDLSEYRSLKNTLTTMYRKILELDNKHREMSTATKGLLLNVKSSFNDLSNKYNMAIKKYSDKFAADYNHLFSENEKLTKELNDTLNKFLDYKSNTSKVLSDYTALSKRRAAITRDIAQLRAEQTINYEERFLYIEPYTKLVDEHFHDIYKYTETVLTEALGKYDIVENKYPKNSQEKIEINRKALFYELRRFDTEIFAGEVFIIIRQISDIINQSEFKGRPKLLDSAYPGLRDTYELIKNKLKDQGISLEKQINHTKPDSFHGDALSSEYIKKMLGKDYNDTSRDIIEKYNGILCSYWRINGQLDSKAAALESELTTVRQQIKDLEAFISKSNMQKSAGQEYGKIIEDNKRQLAELQRQIKNVDNLTFCPDR